MRAALGRCLAWVAGVVVCVPLCAAPAGAHVSSPAAGPGPIWSVTPSPNHGKGTNELFGVSCASATFCAAVGRSYNTSGVEQSLGELWSGSAWSVASGTSAGTGNNSLSGVSCVSSTSCVAVGLIEASSVQQTLIESWNGSLWSVVPSPNQGTQSNALTGVSCASPTFCVAVGSDIGSGTSQPLIEMWDGTSWTLPATPSAGTGAASLSGVSCLSVSFCESVGYQSAGGGVLRTLNETWNGAAWSVTTSANSGTGSNIFQSVSCTSTSFCEAVGTVAVTPSIDTLVEIWNGFSWSVVSSLNVGAGTNDLVGVSCTATSSCQADGFFIPASSHLAQTLIESWNGASTSIVPSPNPATSSNSLESLSCLSSTSCQAVGYDLNTGSSVTTLAESYAQPNPSTTTFAGYKLTPVPASASALLGFTVPKVTGCTSTNSGVGAGVYLATGGGSRSSSSSSYVSIGCSVGVPHYSAVVTVDGTATTVPVAVAAGDRVSVFVSVSSGGVSVRFTDTTKGVAKLFTGAGAVPASIAEGLNALKSGSAVLPVPAFGSMAITSAKFDGLSAGGAHALGYDRRTSTGILQIATSALASTGATWKETYAHA